MSIVVSGASGDLGKRITALLLQHLPASRLILLTRNPAALQALAAQGAQVRKADFDDTAALQQAMKGGEVLMLISTLSIGKRAQQHANAIKAAVAAGIGHIVYTSSCGIQPQTPSISGQEHLATERLLQRSGVKHTILRNSWYADVIAQLLLPMGVATGSIVASTGDGLVAPVAKDDCARIAAGVLRKPWQHENAIYEVTGPELLSFADITRICSEESGRPIRHVNVSHQEKLAIFDAMGVQRDYEEGMMNENTNAWASNEMITYEMAIRRQFFAVCSNHVGLVTGHRPLTLREVIRSAESSQIQSA
ncbi:MAG: NAD(P)H-binding protein [Pseudohongiellaceae bacterium]